MVINKADIVFASGCQLDIAGALFSFKSSLLDLTWKESSLTATLSLSGSNEGNIMLSSTHSLDPVVRSVSLYQVLKAMWNTSEESMLQLKDAITVPSLLAYLTDVPKLDALLFLRTRIPAVLVDAGALLMKPDWTKSTAIAHHTPTGEIALEKAEIYCNPFASLNGTRSQIKSKFNVAGIEISIGDWIFTITNARLPNQKVTLNGSATIQAGSSPATPSPLKLNFTVGLAALQDSGPVFWTFSATSANKLSDITSLFPGNISLDSERTPVPFTADKHISSVPLTASGVGFTLSQPVAGLPDYYLSSIFAATTLKDWESYLPSNFPKPQNATARIEVRNPLNETQRRFAFEVGFTCAIPHISNPNLNNSISEMTVALCAEPLCEKGTYDYRLSVLATQDGVTVPDILGAVGLVTSLDTGVPIINDVLDRVYFKQLEIQLVKEVGGRYRRGDWALSIALEELDVVPEVFELIDAEIEVERFHGEFTCTAKGRFIVAGKVVDVDLLVPKPNETGLLSMNAPHGLTAVDIIQCIFREADPKSIPVIGEILSTQLLSCALTIGQSRSASRAILGGELVIQYPDQLPLGPLILEDVKVRFTHNTADHPLCILPNENPPKSQTMFTIEGKILEANYTITCAYNSVTGVFYAGLKPTPGRNPSITETLEMLLGKKVENALADIIRDVGIMGAYIEWDLSGGSIKLSSFEVHLERKAQVEVHQVQLGSLRLAYNCMIASTKELAGKQEGLYLKGTVVLGKSAGVGFEVSCWWTMPEGKEPLASQDKTLRLSVGVVEGGKNQTLTARDIQDLFTFGKLDVQQPHPTDIDTSKLFTNNAASVQGEILIATDAKTGKKTMELKTLDVIVQAKDLGLKIPINPEISLERFALQVHYKKGERTTACVSAFLKIEAVEIKVIYKDNPNTGQEYSGTWAIRRQSEDPGDTATHDTTLPNFSSIAKQFSPDDADRFPKDMEFPEALPLTGITVRWRPNKSFEIQGRGDTKWPINCFGLDAEILQLGGRLSIFESADTNTPRSSDVTVIGTFKFNALQKTEATASLNLSTKAKPILAVHGIFFPNEIDKIGSLVSKLSSDPDITWDDLIPKSTKPIEFEGEFSVFIDFSPEGMILLSANIKNLGDAVLLGRPMKSSGKGVATPPPESDDVQKPQTTSVINPTKPTLGHCYTFSLALTKIGNLWPDLAVSIDKYFNLQSLVAQIISGDNITVGSLRQDVTEVKSRVQKLTNPFIEHPSLSPEISTKAMTAVSTALDPLLVATILEKGASFYAVLSLDSSTEGGEITQALAASSDQQMILRGGKVVLHATIPLDNPKNTQFRIDVQNFVLLGGALVINGSGSYICNELKKEIRLYASMELTIATTIGPQQEKVDQKVVFWVDCVVNKQMTRFDISNRTEAPTAAIGQTKELKDPFGGMFNVTLTNLSISGRIDKPTATDSKIPRTTYLVSGEVRVWGQVLTANIIFDNGVPRAAIVSVKQVKAESIFTDIIQKGDEAQAGSWPEKYQSAVEFEQATLCYVNGERDYEVQFPDDPHKAGEIVKKAFPAGYSIRADVKFFGAAFQVTAKLSREGMSIKGSYKGKIDFGFLTLVKYIPNVKDAKPTEGPTVEIQTSNKTKKEGPTFKAQSGMVIFGLEGFNLELEYKGQGVYGGEGHYITTTGKSSPTIAFTYQNGHFAFRGWDLKDPIPIDTLDMLEALIDASKNDGKCSCGALVDMVFDNTVKGEFNFKLDVGAATETSDKAGVHIVITGTYKLLIAEQTTAELTLPGALTVNIYTGPYNYQSLINLLVQTMGNNIVALAKSLLDNPGQAAAFFALISVEKFTKEVIKKLLCRNIAPDNVIKRWIELDKPLDPPNPGDKPNPSNPWSDLWTKIKFLLTIAGIGGGAYLAFEYAKYLMLLKTAWEAYNKLKLLIEAFKLLLENAEKANETSERLKELRDQLKRMQEALEEAKKELDSIPKLIRDSLQLKGEPTTAFMKEKGGSASLDLLINWSTVMPEIMYENEARTQYKRMEGLRWQVWTSTDNKEPPATLDDDSDADNYIETTDVRAHVIKNSFKTVRSVYVWVRGRYHDYVATKWTQAQVATHIPQLPPPKQLTLRVERIKEIDHCVVEIPNVQPGEYEVQFVLTAGADTHILAKLGPVAHDSIPWRLPVAKLKNKGRTNKFYVKAQAKMLSQTPAEVLSSEWVFSQARASAPAPKDLQLSTDMSSQELVLEWSQTKQANDTGASPEDYEILVELNGQQLLRPKASRWLPAPDGQRKVAISGWPIEDSREVNVFVRPKSTPTASLDLYAFGNEVISFLPIIKIVTKDSFYDLGASTLHLEFTLLFQGKLDMDDMSYQLLSHNPENDPETEDPLTDRLFDISAREDKTHLTLNMKRFTVPFPIELKLRPVNARGVTGPWSDPWRFPIPADIVDEQPAKAYLPAVTPQVVFNTANRSLSVNWNLAEISSHAITLLEFSIQTVRYTDIDVELFSWPRKKVSATNGTWLVAGNDDHEFLEGQELVVSCRSWKEGLRGASYSTVNYKIPRT